MCASGRDRAIDTSKGGTFAFTVNAEDLAGNKATKTVHYTVKAKAGRRPARRCRRRARTKKVCTSRRQFKIRVKKLKGGVHAVSATVFVNGKKTLTRKGKRVTATVTLKGLKKGQYKVKINVKYSNGKRAQLHAQVQDLHAEGQVRLKGPGVVAGGGGTRVCALTLGTIRARLVLVGARDAPSCGGWPSTPSSNDASQAPRPGMS